MDLLANGRLTDFGALIFALVVTVAIFWAVLARANRLEPERLRLVWPPAERRAAKRLADAADLAAANEAGR